MKNASILFFLKNPQLVKLQNNKRNNINNKSIYTNFRFSSFQITLKNFSLTQNLSKICLLPSKLLSSPIIQFHALEIAHKSRRAQDINSYKPQTNLHISRQLIFSLSPFFVLHFTHSPDLTDLSSGKPFCGTISSDNRGGQRFAPNNSFSTCLSCI